MYRITVLPRQLHMDTPGGGSLLEVLRAAGLYPDAPCGGEGRCGKCRVWVDGREVLACRTTVDRDMTLMLPENGAQRILTSGGDVSGGGETRPGYQLAFDIGTTTVVGYLLHDGQEVACAGMANPQAVFGADVISRIRAAVQGSMEPMTASIRACLKELAAQLCNNGEEIGLVSVVGNPAMQQILLGIPVDNLAQVPFAPVLTRGEVREKLLIVPDIAGFVGADTVACILATGMDEAEELTLLVDIGTNGEMALGNRHKMAACSAAAGPALEGAGIKFGMRGQPGAIDHVYWEDGLLRCTVIGGREAVGICGSGLIDAVAAALDAGWLNARGKILTEDGLIHLTQKIFLDQEDIRQVQLAKGAIAAGIYLMAENLGVTLEQIQRVYLAGAFGSYMNPASACRMGLLPPSLAGKITAVGNAAGTGAKLLARRPDALERAQRIVDTTDALELAALPGFARCFAKNMRF